MGHTQYTDLSLIPCGVSSLVKTLWYSPGQKDLFVRFVKNSTIARYKDIPPELVAELEAVIEDISGSIGKSLRTLVISKSQEHGFDYPDDPDLLSQLKELESAC